LGQAPWHFRPAKNGGNWIGFAVPLGSLVRIESGGRAQIARASSAVGYASSADPRVHFGLGAAGEVTAIRATFPNGVTKDFAPLAGNSYHRLSPDEQKRVK
jgi:hypothetical protein